MFTLKHSCLSNNNVDNVERLCIILDDSMFSFNLNRPNKYNIFELKMLIFCNHILHYAL